MVYAIKCSPCGLGGTGEGWYEASQPARELLDDLVAEGFRVIPRAWEAPGRADQGHVHAPAAALPDAHFEASIARWYFVGGAMRRAVWADQRAGTAAAECVMPDWVARPRRSVGGYLVWLGKDQVCPLLAVSSFSVSASFDLFFIFSIFRICSFCCV